MRPAAAGPSARSGLQTGPRDLSSCVGRLPGRCPWAACAPRSRSHPAIRAGRPVFCSRAVKTPLPAAAPPGAPSPARGPSLELPPRRAVPPWCPPRTLLCSSRRPSSACRADHPLLGAQVEARQPAIPLFASSSRDAAVAAGSGRIRWWLGFGRIRWGPGCGGRFWLRWWIPNGLSGLGMGSPRAGRAHGIYADPSIWRWGWGAHHQWWCIGGQKARIWSSRLPRRVRPRRRPTSLAWCFVSAPARASARGHGLRAGGLRASAVRRGAVGGGASGRAGRGRRAAERSSACADRRAAPCHARRTEPTRGERAAPPPLRACTNAERATGRRDAGERRAPSKSGTGMSEPSQPTRGGGGVRRGAGAAPLRPTGTGQPDWARRLAAKRKRSGRRAGLLLRCAAAGSGGNGGERVTGEE
ncbi:hypothetical protein PVAP13_6KG270012 [Panicum virgatum]|uniref:Uncharacterized protein n=1 Tax=Panicum virgatum TaxID=38727 RepID=A0A8T0RDU1_PANVG|nr:hypothetical protein PVAP13_6KG270012 [Panicum virgatum]